MTETKQETLNLIAWWRGARGTKTVLVQVQKEDGATTLLLVSEDEASEHWSIQRSTT